MTPADAPAPRSDWRALMKGALAGWGLSLGEGEWALLGRYMDDLLEHNEKVNLTAAREPLELARRHLLDGLAPVVELRRRLGPSPRLADLGAGGGFVGFCVKIAWPEADMTLIESSSRKFSFLNLEALRLGLPGLHVRNERGGRAGPGKTYDAVLARAVAPLEDLLPEAFPLLKEGGRLMAYASAPAPESIDPVLARLKGSREGSHAYRLPGEDRERYLLFFRRAELL
mgnify:CR=1 FL=1